MRKIAMRLLNGFSIVAVAATVLTGCGSSTPPPAPPAPTITITSVAINLTGAGCEQDSKLYRTEGYTGSLWFGSNPGVSTEDLQVPITVADARKFITPGSPLTTEYTISFALGAASSWDGVSHLSCVSAAGGERIPLGFTITDSQGKKLSNNTNFTSNTSFNGGLIFVAYSLPPNHGIYLYDSSHPKLHANRDHLSPANKL